MLLRFEDIDFTRVREEYYEAILEDLDWLGITYASDPWRQLDRMEHYEGALEDLRQRGLVYPCFCTRKELAGQSLSAPHGQVGELYSGRCRGLSEAEVAQKQDAGMAYAWRLDATRAAAEVGELTYENNGVRVAVDPMKLGDVVLARKDIKTSYHIAVVVDDAAQGVTDVVRGLDLEESTHVHRVLQALWGFPEPRYHHHALVCDEAGKRLAKRHDAMAIRTVREQGRTPAEVLKMLASEEHLQWELGEGSTAS